MVNDQCYITITFKKKLFILFENKSCEFRDNERSDQFFCIAIWIFHKRILSSLACVDILLSQLLLKICQNTNHIHLI